MGLPSYLHDSREPAIAHRDVVIALAARHRLPAVYNNRLFVAAGGLMSYSTWQPTLNDENS
jgi:hypothetical protein